MIRDAFVFSLGMLAATIAWALLLRWFRAKMKRASRRMTDEEWAQAVEKEMERWKANARAHNAPAPTDTHTRTHGTPERDR